MRSNIAVVGEKESVLGFKAVGFDVHETNDSHQTEKIIRGLAAQDYGIIFITEKAMAPVLSLLEEYKDAPTPAIIPIPGRSGSLGMGLTSVKKSVERAVGADILFKDE